MPKQDPNRKSLKELIRDGEGLSGFAWPDRYVDFDIRILRDGTWTYRGDPIRREKLCRLFATVLQRDDEGTYWLVTPGERGRIQVDDAPFTAVEMVATDVDEAPALSFRTNLDYWVTAGPDHPIRVEEDPETGEPSPYILVRDRLEALIARSVFYDLVDMAEETTTPDGVVLTIQSGGARFVLGRIPSDA
jgi:hypothetical protein